MLGENSNQMRSLHLNILHEKPSIVAKPRLRVVPHFSSGIVERAKRDRAWKSLHGRKGDTLRERVSAFSHFSRSIALSAVWRVCSMRLIKWISQFWMTLVNPKHWICLNGIWDTQTEFITSQGTLDASDFSSAVSGFCQVFIVTRAKNISRSFAAVASAYGRRCVAFGQHRKFPPYARKTSGTQGKVKETHIVKSYELGFII